MSIEYSMEFFQQANSRTQS